MSSCVFEVSALSANTLVWSEVSPEALELSELVEEDEEEDPEEYEVDSSGLLPDELALEFDDDEEELEECEPPLSLGFGADSEVCDDDELLLLLPLLIV